jgi:hypothetical protein
VLTGLSSARPGPSADIATALEQARSALGQRPAITVHHGPPLLAVGGPRQEQGFASLAGWVAKGAHLLRDELGLGPGDGLGLAGPVSWPMATVALAAWWLGVTLIPAREAEVAVLHTSSRGRTADGATLLWFGDAIDGTGLPDAARAPGEWWTEAVVPFPDRPPSPVRDGGAIAVRAGAAEWTQRALLDVVSDASGVLGLIRGVTDTAMLDAELLALLALRPLVTGSATVVLAAVDGTVDQVGSALARIATEERIVAWSAPTPEVGSSVSR